MEKKDPRAREPEGSPGVSRLAALTIAFGVRSGCAMAGARVIQVDKKIRYLSRSACLGIEIHLRIKGWIVHLVNV